MSYFLNMINYLHLWGYRNLCEFLDQQWYKFAEIDDIKQKCKGVLPILYSNPKNKIISNYLWNKYLIQFIYFGKHPILRYTSSKKTEKAFKNNYGWTLVSDWEYKIEYLEKIILFNQEPLFKPWEEKLLNRINERKTREEIKRLQNRLLKLDWKERVIECEQLDIC
jgi:hypothetical protein